MPLLLDGLDRAPFMESEPQESLAKFGAAIIIALALVVSWDEPLHIGLPAITPLFREQDRLVLFQLRPVKNSFIGFKLTYHPSMH